MSGPAPLAQLLAPGYKDISNPGVSWAVGNSGKQLLYPDWMEGTWQVKGGRGNTSITGMRGRMGSCQSFFMSLPILEAINAGMPGLHTCFKGL